MVTEAVYMTLLSKDVHWGWTVVVLERTVRADPLSIL